jgi:hypothetical protein
MDVWTLFVIGVVLITLLVWLALWREPGKGMTMNENRLWAIYRCQVCGKLFDEEDDDTAVLARLLLAVPYLLNAATRKDVTDAEPCPETYRHVCSDDLLGVGHFVGYGRVPLELALQQMDNNRRIGRRKQAR